MRGESMKGKSKKSTYSTTFGIDPKNQPIPQPLVLTLNIRKKTNREFYGWFKLKTERMRFELTVGV